MMFHCFLLTGSGIWVILGKGNMSDNSHFSPRTLIQTVEGLKRTIPLKVTAVMVVSEIPSKQGKCHQKFANANKNSVHKFATLQTYLCLKLIKVWHHALEWGGQRTFSVLSTIPHILYIFCGMLWWTFYDGGQWYTVGATIF